MSNPYPKSNMPAARSNTVVVSQPVNPNSGRTFFDTSRAQQAARGKGPILPAEGSTTQYPSMVWATKLVIPRHPSDLRQGNFDEVLARDLGRFISSRVREALRIGADQARSVVAHYQGSVRGLGLFDENSQAGFEKMAAQFAASPSEESMQPVEQYLNGLVPEARGGE
jgi:hypothetical protein